MPARAVDRRSAGDRRGSVKRRELIQMAGAPLILGAPALADAASSLRKKSPPPVSKKRHQLIGAELQLTLDIGDTFECHLVHRPSSVVLADGPYSYSFGAPRFTAVDA